jgi:regulator of sirC expression with transglutaminase-like and TPR domain
VWDGQDGRAISDLTSVIDTSADPDLLTAAALRARGVAFAALGKPSQAIADYEAYLSLLPRATDRAKVLGWINALSVAA